jgi:hypothetical protein
MPFKFLLLIGFIIFFNSQKAFLENYKDTLINNQLPNIIINEFLPNPDGNDKGNEFIELLNLDDYSLKLEDIYIKIGNKKIQLQGEIKPHDYFVITNKDYNFNIRNQGETIEIYTKNNDKIFSISYKGKAVKGKSFSRQNNGLWKFTQPTPGKKNVFSQKKEFQDNLQNKNNQIDKNSLSNFYKLDDLQNFKDSFEKDNSYFKNNFWLDYLYMAIFILIINGFLIFLLIKLKII